MLIKPRKVRHSAKFQSRMRTSSRQRQEMAVSVMTTAVVQGILAVALVIAALRAYQAVSLHSESPLILVLPVAFVIGAAWCVRLCFKNIRAARETWSMSRRPTPPPE